MNFDDFQFRVMRTAAPTATTRDAIIMSALGLAGESGEVADIIKKSFYHQHTLHHEMVTEELGDLLWYISRMCTALGVRLEEVAVSNIKKLEERYPEGFSSERSIDRR